MTSSSKPFAWSSPWCRMVWSSQLTVPDVCAAMVSFGTSCAWAAADRPPSKASRAAMRSMIFSPFLMAAAYQLAGHAEKGRVADLAVRRRHRDPDVLLRSSPSRGANRQSGTWDAVR